MKGHGYRSVIWVASTAMVLLIAQTASAKGYINTNWRGLAVKGYDTVAYFTEGKPVKGKSAFTFEWKKASWRFSSQEHLDLFKSDPKRYAPQYGGY